MSEALKLIVQFLLTFLAAGLAFFGAYLISRGKSREDAIERRCDEMCKILSDLVQLSEAYWSVDQAKLKDELLETKIMAGQNKLCEMRTQLEKFISQDSSTEIINGEQAFQRIITGGNFGVHNRTAGITRIKDAILSAQTYETKIRMAHLNDLAGVIRR